jgi:hypothetical protein
MQQWHGGKGTSSGMFVSRKAVNRRRNLPPPKRKSPEGNDGLRHRDVKELPHLRKGRSTNGIKGWSTGHQSYLGSGGTLRMNLYEIFRGILAKQIVGTQSGLRKMKEWTLWRSRPLPKCKKEFQVERELVM